MEGRGSSPPSRTCCGCKHPAMAGRFHRIDPAASEVVASIATDTGLDDFASGDRWRLSLGELPRGVLVADRSDQQQDYPQVRRRPIAGLYGGLPAWVHLVGGLW